MTASVEPRVSLHNVSAPSTRLQRRYCTGLDVAPETVHAENVTEVYDLANITNVVAHRSRMP